MEPLRRMRLMAVRLSLLLMAVAAALAYPFDRIVAHGILLGGVAGTLGFWIMAVRMEKLASLSENVLKSDSLWWSGLRFTLYVLALARAYTLDRQTFRGFVAAAAGLFIIRLVVAFLGVTGLDSKPEEK